MLLRDEKGVHASWYVDRGFKPSLVISDKWGVHISMQYSTRPLCHTPIGRDNEFGTEMRVRVVVGQVRVWHQHQPFCKVLLRDEEGVYCTCVSAQRV